jgi:hypothetical protein
MGIHDVAFREEYRLLVSEREVMGGKKKTCIVRVFLTLNLQQTL